MKATASRLFAEPVRHGSARLHQGQRGFVLADEQVPQVLPQSGDEMVRIEAGGHDLLQLKEHVPNPALQRSVDHIEVDIVPKNIEVAGDRGIGHAFLAGGHHLVEDAKRIAHGAIGPLGNHIERFRLGGDTLLHSHVREMVRDVPGGDAPEIVDLAAAQDGRKNLVLLRRGEDEDRVLWRLLERLEERVEGILGQHVDLVNDVDLITSVLRRDAHLVDDAPDVFDTIVGRRVQFEDIETALGLFGGEPVDGVGKNPRAGGFADPTGTTEEVGLGNLSRLDAVTQGVRDGLLAHHRVPGGRAIFAC